MHDTAEELRQEIEKSVGLMRTLSGEIRVKLHLAGMEAKDEWRNIEPALWEVERAAVHFSETASRALSAVLAHLSPPPSKPQ